ncbi:unnamed protein product [Rhodiola kirilowii]
MPAQKRPLDPDEDEPQQDADEDLQPDVDELEQSDSSSSEEEISELVDVNLLETRKEVQCPICLGIIRKTRTVMECLHRFCRECIDKSMRLGNNECPACRTHCASRRSLRDDPIFDTLISILYPDIDKHEKEELAFHEEEEMRNKQIQASIAETVRRQNEALGKKKQTAKAATAAAVYARRSNRRKKYRATEHQVSDDSEDTNGNEGAKESSADEPDIRSRRPKRWMGSRYSQPSSVGFNPDGGNGNDTEATREPVLASAALGGGSDRLAWGQIGLRSNNRSGNGKNGRNSRVHKLIDHFRHLGENKLEQDLDLLLVSLDEQNVPSLQRPYLSCKPNQTVEGLCQYVAYQTRMQPCEIELLVVKEHALKSYTPTSNPMPSSATKLPQSDDVEVVDFQETVGGLKDVCNTCATHMLLAYRRKKLESGGSRVKTDVFSHFC